MLRVPIEIRSAIYSRASSLSAAIKSFVLTTIETSLKTARSSCARKEPARNALRTALQTASTTGARMLRRAATSARGADETVQFARSIVDSISHRHVQQFPSRDARRCDARQGSERHAGNTAARKTESLRALARRHGRRLPHDADRVVGLSRRHPHVLPGTNPERGLSLDGDATRFTATARRVGWMLNTTPTPS